MEKGGGLRMGGKFAALGALGVCIKGETPRIRSLAKHHAGVGKVIRVERRKRHRFRVVDFRPGSLFEPGLEEGERVAGVGEMAQGETARPNELDLGRLSAGSAAPVIAAAQRGDNRNPLPSTDLHGPAPRPK